MYFTPSSDGTDTKDNLQPHNYILNFTLVALLIFVTQPSRPTRVNIKHQMYSLFVISNIPVLCKSHYSSTNFDVYESYNA